MVLKSNVKVVVREYGELLSINSNPMHCQQGKVNLTDAWYKLEMDITHYNERHYLMLINCVDSQFGDLSINRIQQMSSYLEALFMTEVYE